MALPAYVQKVFDEQITKTQGTPTPTLSAVPPKTIANEEPQVESSLPDYVRKAVEEKKQLELKDSESTFENWDPGFLRFKDFKKSIESDPQDPKAIPKEWDPEWMREHPVLSGLYGAGKGLLEQAIVPSIEALGMVGGSLGSPILGTSLGYGIARQVNDYLVDGYKRLGGEDPRRPTVSEEMMQSAADVGTALILGGAMETGAKVAPMIEDYMFHTLPKRLYGRAIGTPMSKKWIKTLPDEIVSKQTAAVEEGLNSRVAPGKYGLLKIKGLQREVLDYIDDITKVLSEDPSKTISRESVLERGLEKAYAKASNSGDPEGAKAIVDSIADRFRSHPKNLTPAKANQIKRQLYEEVKFGGSESTAIQSQMNSVGKKGVAREIMLNLEETYPALKELNATDAARISLHEAIERSFAQEYKGYSIPLGAKVLLHPKTWPLALWEATIGHPQIKARLAFALHKANPTVYPAKPSSYVPPKMPKPEQAFRYEPPTKPPVKSPQPKPLPKVESPGAVVDKPITGTYTPDQLNKMLKSKNVSEVDMAIDDIIDVRKKVQVNERERVNTINNMLKTIKNERGSIGDQPLGKKNPIELVDDFNFGGPERYTAAAVRAEDRTVMSVDYSKGGHIEAINKLSPKQQRGKIEDGMITSEGRFVKRPTDEYGDIDVSDLIGKEVSIKSKPSTAEFNKQFPGHDLKYDGIQEGFGNIPDRYQVTPQSGPLKGRTFNVESLEPKFIKAKMDEMKPKETRFLKYDISKYPKGTEVTLTGKMGGFADENPIVRTPDGKEFNVSEKGLTRGKGNIKIESLPTIVKREGDNIHELILEWDGNARLSSDGKTITTFADPRNQTGKVKASNKDFAEWYAEHNLKRKGANK